MEPHHNMTTRAIETERDRELFRRLVAGQKLPFVAQITAGRKRSLAQNRLGRQWCNEIAEQLGDRTAEEVRAECKLTHGVPILRAENDHFCEKYDKTVKPLPYETKLAIMAEPLDMPVTRLMTTKQKTAYLDAIHRHYTEQGCKLTSPDGI